MNKKFYVVIEKDGKGNYMASIAGLPGCCAQARTLNELAKNVRDAVKHYLKTEKDTVKVDFISVQMVGI